MSHRPYPSVDRALHQLDRHDDETRPQNATVHEPVTAALAVERWAAAMRAAVPTAQQLAASWAAALKPRPVSSEEKTT
jgi:hypothetical protein